VADQRLRVANLNASDVNSCIINYYQASASPGNVRDAVVFELLAFIIEEPAFDILRTKHQLGYSVYASQLVMEGVVGVRVYVASQADKHSAGVVHDRIEEFLHLMVVHLETLSAERFDNFVTSLVELKQTQDNSMSDEFERNWRELQRQELLFGRLEKEIEELRSVTLKDVLSHFKRTCVDPVHRKKLSIQVEAAVSKSEAGDASASAASQEKTFDMALRYLPTESDCMGSGSGDPGHVTWCQDVVTAKAAVQYHAVHRLVG